MYVFFAIQLQCNQRYVFRIEDMFPDSYVQYWINGGYFEGCCKSTHTHARTRWRQPVFAAVINNLEVFHLQQSFQSPQLAAWLSRLHTRSLTGASHNMSQVAAGTHSPFAHLELTELVLWCVCVCLTMLIVVCLQWASTFLPQEYNSAVCYVSVTVLCWWGSDCPVSSLQMEEESLSLSFAPRSRSRSLSPYTLSALSHIVIASHGCSTI